jgi:aryl-alcohol dehydrogenase-like predicted oxidoreductase
MGDGTERAGLKVKFDNPPPGGDRVFDARKIAGDRGVPMAQIALAWVLRNPVVDSVLSGATKPHHRADAAAALGLSLTDDELRALEEPYVTRTPTYFQ